MPRLLVFMAVLLAVAGCGADEPAPLPQGAEPVELDPADFSADVDHAYWPMAPGSTWVYREGSQRVEVTVTHRTKTIARVEARVVHDVVSEDGEVVEDTLDWYAQDGDGNVWYLGEDTTEFEDGKPVSTEGSWEHGVDGAQAGILLPADPEVGMAYRQEHYADEAEDEGKVLSLDEVVHVPFGSFSGALMTEDTTPLEPGLVEHKYYVRDVGPVLAVTVSGGSGREELVRYSRP